MLNINNRRYIGCKTKLLEKIYNSVATDNSMSFMDVFAGTGTVAYYYALKGYPVIVNDNLYSNYVAYKAWFSEDPFNNELIKNEIEKFNKIQYSELKDNYFSEIYGGKYFSIDDAKKIGFIREYIEENKTNFTEREYFILLSALIYTTDRIANTCGHFEHYLKGEPVNSNFVIQNLELLNLKNCKLYNMDANELVKNEVADIVYLDPPYNARQYVNFYHVLENLARWNKPTEFEGISMKFKRNELKSGYSTARATDLMEDLVSNIKAKIIIVSYNNTYNAKSGASNNKITEEDMERILSSKGKLTIHEIDYKYFDSGKTKFDNHKEKIYVCEVGVE